MNAPTATAHSLRRRLAEQRADAKALAIQLWREGRSLAGIIFEVVQAHGIEFRPRPLLKMIERARLKDATIPRPFRDGSISHEDTRANVFDYNPRVTLASAGPWDGDQ